MAEGGNHEGVFPAWTATVDEVAQHHGVDIATGLTEAQVDSKRAEFGYNELEKEPGKSLFALVLEQFDDMLVKVGIARLILLDSLPDSGVQYLLRVSHSSQLWKALQEALGSGSRQMFEHRFDATLRCYLPLMDATVR